MIKSQMVGILYQEISKKLKQDIISGKYPVGTFMPTENELTTLFSVGKITIRRAV